MPAVDIFNPIPPDWYVEAGPDEVARCVELVRNGNAVFWKTMLHNPAWDAPRPDYGLFCPGSGNTPEGSTLYVPPEGRAGLTLPGLEQYVPGSPGYPHVTTGAVLINIAGSGITFHLS